MLRIRKLARALTWLKKQPAGAGNEPAALRLVIEKEFGEPRRAKELLDELIKRQNAGWQLELEQGIPGGCLRHGPEPVRPGPAGLKDDNPAVQRARKFLLETQRPDGSWYAPTKPLTGTRPHSRLLGQRSGRPLACCARCRMRSP